MLHIELGQIEQIKTHAIKTYPEECCGLLLGKDKLVKQVWETENTWSGEIFTTPDASKRNRFSIAPQTLLDATKKARQLHLDIIGIYHSHPDHPPKPSEFDRAIAHFCYSYLIISLTEGQTQSILSWVLDDNHQFQLEEIIMI
jgi:proteasome lid subunit RPN8/RPN11